MLRDPLFENYCRLLEKVDLFCSQLLEKHRLNIACRRGCADCCKQDLRLLPVEFHFLQQGLGPTDREALCKPSRPGPQCALLHRGACRHYRRRPVICRTHGLPLLILTGSGERRDCCPGNFKKQPLDRLPQTDLLHLERLNTLLVAVNAVFCRHAGLDPSGRLPVSGLVTRDAEAKARR